MTSTTTGLNGQNSLIKEYFQVSSKIFAVQSQSDLQAIRQRLNDLRKSMQQQQPTV